MSSTTQSIPIASPSTRAKELALSARQLLEDLKGLEVEMVSDRECQPCPEKRPSSSASLSRRERSLPGCQKSPTSPPPPHHHHQKSFFSSRQRRLKSSNTTFEEPIDRKHHVTTEFVTFCDHLLYMNRIWKQEQQIRSLRASIRAIEKEKSSNAFQSFCDRLLVSNKIWQLERQIRDLVAEGERDRRARVAAITHAAKQMAVDVRKEAMIEEFVVELVEELEESKRMVEEMKDGHEKEIREIHGDWLKEYRRLFWENERLRLDRRSRLVEQEVSNELEQSLYDALGWSQQRIDELENFGDLDSTLVGDISERESILFSRSEFSADETLTDELADMDEGMSTTSSATYVSSQKWSTKSGAAMTGSQRQAKLSRHASDALRRQSLRKLDVTPYAGFSFNPLFFGNTETLVVSPSRAIESPDTPVKAVLKHVPSSKTSLRDRKDSTPMSLGPTGTRAPWRI